MIQAITIYTLLGLASWEDLRIREVPFLLSHSLIILGVAFSALAAAQTNALTPLFHGVLGGAVAYGLGYLLYVTGQWGGGDVQLLTGVGTFIGFDPFAAAPFASYILLVFIAGSLYGLGLAAWLMIRHRDVVRAELPSMTIVRIGIGTFALTTVAAGVAALISETVVSGLLGSIALLAASLTIMYVFNYAEDALTVVEKQPDELVPGDWLVDEVRVEDGVVECRSEGISVEDIHRIRRDHSGDVTVREGVPFVPSFFFAYLLFDVGAFNAVIQVLV
jgi:Flp pilus assembly protein protease CpaA